MGGTLEVSLFLMHSEPVPFRLPCFRSRHLVLLAPEPSFCSWVERIRSFWFTTPWAGTSVWTSSSGLEAELSPSFTKDKLYVSYSCSCCFRAIFEKKGVVQKHLYSVILKLEAFQIDTISRKKPYFSSCVSLLLSYYYHTHNISDARCVWVLFPHNKQFCDTNCRTI